MSVLVKGMEMPTSCDGCVAEFGGCCFVAPPETDGVCPDHGKADWCPLVEVDDNEINEAMKALKGVRAAYRIITEAFCRPPETDIGSKPK